jgi:hypothetical protein
MKAKIPDELNDYDWKEVFEYAKPSAVITDEGEISTAPFTREDVQQVIAKSDGEHDERDWVAVLKLRDGRYASISAGCDYTGWDCQANGHAQVARKKKDIIRFGLTEDERERLGFKLA